MAIPTRCDHGCLAEAVLAPGKPSDLPLHISPDGGRRLAAIVGFPACLSRQGKQSARPVNNYVDAGSSCRRFFGTTIACIIVLKVSAIAPRCSSALKAEFVRSAANCCEHQQSLDAFIVEDAGTSSVGRSNDIANNTTLR